MAFANWLALPTAPKVSPPGNRQSSGQATTKTRKPASASAGNQSSADGPERTYLSLVGKNIGQIEARVRGLEFEVRDAVAMPAKMKFLLLC